MIEAREALRKADLQSALEKYRLARQIFWDRKDTKKHKEVQQIISELEQKKR